MRNQRILIVSSLFPPDVLGGAEMSAYNLAHWLKNQGAEVGVLTTAKTKQEAHDAQRVDGVTVWRVWMPRPYPQFDYAKARWWQKIIWHLQDHLDPRNPIIMQRVIAAFQPTHISLHLIQGLGYNILRSIAGSRVPATIFLHDLSLACFRMGMFKKGKVCERQCMPCLVSSTLKRRMIERMPGIQFISPSRANLEMLARYFPVKRWPHAVILNANQYPKPTVVIDGSAAQDNVVRFLFVGRLHASKGASILLQAAALCAAYSKLVMTIVGSGEEEALLRQRYGSAPWCQFKGFLSQTEISNELAQCDALCVPSQWAENSPGVVVHALSQGVPVLGTDKGGMSELIEHEKNGLLVNKGDVEAWRQALTTVLETPHMMRAWKDYARANATRFDQEQIGHKIAAFIRLRAHPQLAEPSDRVQSDVGSVQSSSPS